MFWKACCEQVHIYLLAVLILTFHEQTLCLNKHSLQLCVSCCFESAVLHRRLPPSERMQRHLVTSFCPCYFLALCLAKSKFKQDCTKGRYNGDHFLNRQTLQILGGN